MDEKIEAYRAELVSERKRALECGWLQERGKVLSEAINLLDKHFPPPPKIEPLSVWRLKGSNIDMLAAYVLVAGIDSDGAIAHCWRRQSMDWQALKEKRFREDFEPVTDAAEIARAKAWICEGKREEASDGE